MHFELIIIYSDRERSNFILFFCDHPVVLAPFVKNMVDGLGTHVKYQLTVDVLVYFWTLHSGPLT